MAEGTTQAIVRVHIDEGKQVRVRDLILHGNREISSLALRFQLETKGSWLFFRNYYDSEAFQNDLDLLRQYYFSKGYFDAQVRAGEFVSRPDAKWVSPVIEIKEGRRYRVGEVRPLNYRLFMRDEIIEPFEALRGRYYNAEAFGRSLQRVRDMYGDEGYINAEIHPAHELDSARGIVNFDLRVEENKRIYVRKVLIQRPEYPAEGFNFFERLFARFSPPVADEVIRREVLLKPNEAYRRFQETATVDRLRSLGIFDTVKVEPQLTDDETQRDILISVEEGVAGNLVLGFGVGEPEGAFVHGGYINRNLFGQARHLRTFFLLGTRDVAFRISYLDRYFNPPGARLDGYFARDPSELVPFRFDIYHEALRFREYDETHSGVSAAITRILRRGYLAEDYGIRLEYVRTEQDGYHSNWRYFGSGDRHRHEAEEDFGDYPVAALMYYIEENTTDDWWWPTRGHILGGGVEAGFADGPLLRLTGRYSLYKKLHENLIYALNARLGWMPLNAHNVGISERLFMGGAGDLRGFAFRGAGPVDDDDDDLHIGGSTKLLVQNELRFPIFSFPMGELKGFAFMDVGMLGKRPFELDTPRVSAGAGLRFSTAKGRRYGPRWRSTGTEFDLLRGFHAEVSLGAPLVRDSDDDTQFLHFAFGTSF